MQNGSLSHGPIDQSKFLNRLTYGPLTHHQISAVCLRHITSSTLT